MTQYRPRALPRAACGLAVAGMLTAGLALPSYAAGTPVGEQTTHRSAHAQTNSSSASSAKSGSAPAADAAEAEGPGKLMLVMDSSGSMAESAGGGTSRIEAARAALNTAVDGLPGQAEVGMRVYGATVESKQTDPKGACTDSQAVVPPGTDNRAKLRKQIDAYKPFGETPTGYALRQAGDDLGTEGKRSIVLVSDGESNCQPDPCKVAAELANQGIDLTIDVVGLNVSGKAREQLKCVADSGNGTYYDADDAEDLTAGIDKLSTRAFRPFELSGKPLELSDTGSGAPEIEPGQYTPKLAASGEDGYAVVRKKPGSSLWASLTMEEDTKATATRAEVELETPEGDHCGGNSNGETELDGQSDVFSLGTLVDPLSVPADWDIGCKQADRLVVRVHTSNDYDDTDHHALRSELVLVEEPSVPKAEHQGLPGKVDNYEGYDPDPRWQPQGSPSEVTGGTSFSNAKTLTPGTYADTILPGESLTYRVRLQHGQRARFVSRFAELGSAEQDAFSNVHDSLDVNAYGPTRDELATNHASFEGDTIETPNVETPQVRYLNRDTIREETEPVRGAAMGGYYYFTVHASEQKKPVMMPFEIDLRVDGEPSAEPPYAGDGQVLGPVSVTADPNSVPSRGSSGSSEDNADDASSATGSGSSDTATAEGEGGESDDGGGENADEDDAGLAAWDGELTSIAVPVGLGLLLALAAVLAVLLLRRPRDRTPPGPNRPVR